VASDDRLIVRVGARVRLRGHEGVEDEVTLVGSAEEHGLHLRTPLGRALLGRREGDEVEVVTDAGTAKFTIVRVTN
jgi:transcription elongation GreA/GreB family factor